MACHLRILFSSRICLTSGRACIVSMFPPRSSLWQFLPELMSFCGQEVAADVGKRAGTMLLIMHFDSSGNNLECVLEVP